MGISSAPIAARDRAVAYNRKPLCAHSGPFAIAAKVERRNGGKAMNDEQLLTVIRFLLIKIQDVAVQCSAMQVVLHVNGISSPEDLDAKVQQLADSEGFRNERSEILNLIDRPA
jgi:hypothetical protein